MTAPNLSVVIPVYNEAPGLPALFDRLYRALDALQVSYEVIFIDDGSRDRSATMLVDQYEARPDHTRVLILDGNFGQHRAILAGFSIARGARVVTLDADLQNPPEEIGVLLAAMDAGHDYVGSIRRERDDVAWRRWASRVLNKVRERTTRIKMTDQGCMLRAYDRRIITAINQCREINTFIPALAFTFARNPTEVEVAHSARFAGESKYSLYSLVRLNFDLLTSFTIMPLQLFSMLGMVVSAGSGLLFIVLLARRLFIGPEEGGVFTLFALVFFLLGIALFGIGLLGEYVGRIFQQVQDRPRFLVRALLQRQSDEGSTSRAPQSAMGHTAQLGERQHRPAQADAPVHYSSPSARR